MHRRLVAAFLAALASATVADAQSTNDNLPRFVIDAQGTYSGLPNTSGWVPAVPVNTPIPGHGFGVGFGAHVYVFKLGVVTFGVGGNAIVARKNGGTYDTTAGEPTTPSVTTQVTSLNPQISMNFGHRLGWSYLSGGYSTAKVKSESTAFKTTVPAAAAPELWNPGFNYGGGARWFMKPHLAGSFDVRFVQLSSREASPEHPVFALRTRMINWMVGISIQ
jgi:opacity protein-like surface antigen